jgi:hypothetical protein
MKNPITEPKPYAIGLAVAFALLAPVGTSSESKSPGESSPLLGAASACANDNCEPWGGWICIHGPHKDYNYKDPAP